MCACHQPLHSTLIYSLIKRSMSAIKVRSSPLDQQLILLGVAA